MLDPLGGLGRMREAAMARVADCPYEAVVLENRRKLMDAALARVRGE